MITGAVNAQLEAVIHLTVAGPRQEREIEAIIDTGFTGFLTFSPSLMADLELPFRSRGRGVLADGNECIFDIHEAIVLWDGQPRRVAAAAADTIPLVGMALLHGHELTIHTVTGGKVTIT